MNQQRKKTVNNVQLGIFYQSQPQPHQQQIAKPVYIAKHQTMPPATASVSNSSQSVSKNFVPTPASIHSSSSSSSSSSCSTTNIDNHRTHNNINNNNNNNNSFLSANELNFKNFQLQQALKAATAALQKSKISTIDQTSISITKNNNNNNKNTTIIKPIMPGNQHSFKPYSKPPSSISTCESPAQYNQQRNTTLIIDTQLPQPQLAVTRTANTSDYDNLDQDNIDISVNLINQNKIHNKNKHQQQETPQLEQQEQETTSGKLHDELPTNNENISNNEIIISAMLSSSSASSSLSSSSSSASSSLMNTHNTHNTHNNINSNNKQQNSDILLSSRSSTQSSNHANHHHNSNKLDLEDLRLLNESANHHNNHEPLLKQNNNNKSLTNKTKHKSVSIDHLNVTDLELAVGQNSHNDNNNNNSTLADHLYENCPSSSNNSRGLPPPPHIQPYSGVLSKSLFSVVLKPQPMKPLAAVNTSSLEKTHIIKHQHRQQQQEHLKNNLTMKKKCVSTANLKFNEVNNNHLSSFSPANHKSVSFLDSDTLTGRVIAVTEELDEDNEQDNEQEEKTKHKKLQELLALKTAEIKQLKQKLKTACEQNQIYEREREISADELEEERQIYEQKLSSIRSHFNQQLSFFEQNERQCLQDRVKSLQQSFNDLKCNYQKNLDQDLKNLKQKLTESQMANQQLAKQLQEIQLSSKCNCITSQTTINNKANVKQHELLHILKQIKNENNDLKFQLNAERERFQIEKEKWINEKRKVIQFQTYLQHHNKGELNNNNNNNNTMVFQSNQGVEHINNNKSPNLSIPIQHQQPQPQTVQSHHQERLYNNKNNKYIQQNNNNTFL